MRTRTTIIVSMLFQALILIGPANAQQDTAATVRDTMNARMGSSQDTGRSDTAAVMPAMEEQASAIGIRGKVSVVGERSFILAYEGGSIAVAYGGEALRQHRFEKDQEVTVYGTVEQGFFDQKVLKAQAVVVQGQDPIGDAGPVKSLITSPVKGAVVHGRVTDISGRQITLGEAEGRVIVDTSGLAYDPARSEGHKRVEVGDLVTAQGLIKSDLWSGRLFRATALDVVKYSQLATPAGDQE